VRDTTIARNYAEVLFDLGERHGGHEAFAAAFEEWSRLLGEEPQLRTFLETPKLDAATKKAAVERAFGERVPRLFLNFVLVVIDKRRQRLFQQIEEVYRSLLEEKLGHVHAQVTLASEPDERLEREIAQELSGLLGRTVIPHVRVDPGIIGGIVVRYGDRVLDGSVRRRLVAIRRRMMEADLPRPGA
jgi:F-type H+-transporting ATPase subunit delta